ncbi:hypothetical protein Asppvi_008691 [Aspergillus pseudoviridinutans]|uniref:Uncharacterized protein n=1 Tax=Aspergillus pseudoviridinutans TaxID=1517512 RepID=A0A9P3BEB6_9EURO|nr:uncharacterized protein Asppvi_008691 [Aspergillus pseudoviridinutans]GIJ89746.1 hypothetical protein Asppvi_008691 [Aspergillus pseudoviridinutans]
MVLIPEIPTHMKPGTGTTAGGVNWVGYLTTAEYPSLVLSCDLAVGGAIIGGSLVGSTANDLVGSKRASAPWTSEDAVLHFGLGSMSTRRFTFAPVWTDVGCLLENSIGSAYYRTNASTFVPQLIGRLEDLVGDIYSSWGRKYLSINVPPTSRTPMFIKQGDWAVELSAAYLAVYNQQLAAMVERFKSSDWWNDYHPGTKYHQRQAEDTKASLVPLGAW